MRRRDQLPAAAAAVGGRRPGDLLRGLGIPVVADLPGVGENLQDHLEVYVQHALHAAGVDAALPGQVRHWPGIGARWLFLRSGPGATNHFEAGGFVRSNDDVDYPNLMFHFLPIAVRYDGTRARGRARLPGARRADVLRRPRHRARSPAPTRASTRRCGSTTCPPTRTAGSGWRRSTSTRNILDQPALRAFDGGELSPGPEVQTDEQILDWVGRDAETALHPCCTAAMGTGADVGRRPAHDAGARHRAGCGSSTRR